MLEIVIGSHCITIYVYINENQLVENGFEVKCGISKLPSVRIKNRLYLNVRFFKFWCKISKIYFHPKCNGKFWIFEKKDFKIENMIICIMKNFPFWVKNFLSPLNQCYFTLIDLKIYFIHNPYLFCQLIIS